MTCHDARELFSARLDAQLGANDDAQLAEHLAGCEECRREWARFEGVVSLIHAAPPARAPVGFVDRVLEAARPVPWPLRVLRQVFVPLRVKVPVEAAALLLIGGLAVMVFQRSPEMQRMATQDHAPGPAPAAPGATTPPPSVAERPVTVTEPSAPATSAAPATPAAPATKERRELKSDAQPQIAPSQHASPAAPPAAATPPVVATPPAAGGVAQEMRRDMTDSARRESVAKSAAPPTDSSAATATAPAPSTRPQAVAPAAPAAATPVVTPLAARVRATEPDVSARLTVADRPAALAALAESLTRIGGREQARRAESDADVVDIVIPRGAYDAFVHDMRQLGGFSAERQPAELPASIRVSLRITR